MSLPLRIDSPDDPRLLPYRELKDKTLAARQGLFAVEGELTVRRLLASPLAVHSLLMTPQRYAAGGWPAERCPIFLAEREILSGVVGFDFHRGVLALAVQPPLRPLEELQPESAPHLLVLPEINDPINLGGLLRTAAAFGWNAILLGPSCANPYCRRTVRTSMGALFRQVFYRLASPAQLLELRRAGYALHAAVVQESGIPLAQVAVPERVALLLGNEAHGLGAEWRAVCDLVRIPMQPDVDSLNVVVAAGILMAYYSRILPTHAAP